MEDISALANFCVDEESWQVLLQLFRKKWTEDVPQKVKGKLVKEAVETAVGYFLENWCEKEHCRRWFAGNNPLGPMRERSLEFVNVPQQVTEARKTGWVGVYFFVVT